MLKHAKAEIHKNENAKAQNENAKAQNENAKTK